MLRVPKIIHFTWVSDQPTKTQTPFHMFAAVATARAMLKPDKIFMHHNDRMCGLWWDRLTALVDEMHAVTIPTRWGNKPIIKMAHASDYLRMQALTTYGGIYLDTDTLSVRSVDDLLIHEAVLGFESYFGCCNAVMMFAKDSAFLKEWLRIYADHFVPDGWAEASLTLPSTMAKQMPHLPLHMEPEAAFYLPKWWDLDQIFLHSNPIPDEQRILHFWHNEAKKHYLPLITDMEWVYNNSHTLFGRIILNAEPEWQRMGIVYK